MDTLTRQLMVEIAKTVLRVLDAQPAKVPQPVNPEAVPTPWATAVNREADKGTPKQLAQLTTTELVAKLKNPDAGPVLGREAGMAQRGDTVQFWDGNRYSIGIV